MRNRLLSSKKLLPSLTKTETAQLLPRYFCLHQGTGNCDEIFRSKPYWGWVAGHDQRSRRRWKRDYRFPWVSIIDGEVLLLWVIEKWRTLTLKNSWSKLSRSLTVTETAWFLQLSCDTWWPILERSWPTRRSTRWSERQTSMEMDTSTTRSSSEWWWQDDKWLWNR